MHATTVCEALTGMLDPSPGEDEVPALYFIFRASGGYQMAASTSLVPEAAWSAQEPAQVLDRLASAFTYAPARPSAQHLPPGMAGVVLVRREGHEYQAWAAMLDGSRYTAMCDDRMPGAGAKAWKMEKAFTDSVGTALDRVVKAMRVGVN